MLPRPTFPLWPILPLILSVVGICRSRTLPPPTHSSSERPTVERQHPNPQRVHRVEHKPRDLERFLHTANATFSAMPEKGQSRLQHAPAALKEMGAGCGSAIGLKDDILANSRLRRCCCKYMQQELVRHPTIAKNASGCCCRPCCCCCCRPCCCCCCRPCCCKSKA